MSSIVWMISIIGSVVWYSEVGSIREVCFTYQEYIYGIKMKEGFDFVFMLQNAIGIPLYYSNEVSEFYLLVL